MYSDTTWFHQIYALILGACGTWIIACSGTKGCQRSECVACYYSNRHTQQGTMDMFNYNKGNRIYEDFVARIRYLRQG